MARACPTLRLTPGTTTVHQCAIHAHDASAARRTRGRATTARWRAQRPAVAHTKKSKKLSGVQYTRTCGVARVADGIAVRVSLPNVAHPGAIVQAAKNGAVWGMGGAGENEGGALSVARWEPDSPAAATCRHSLQHGGAARDVRGPKRAIRPHPSPVQHTITVQVGGRPRRTPRQAAVRAVQALFAG